MSMLRKAWNKLRREHRRLVVWNYRRRLKNHDFTLISQNCVGGVMYNVLGLPFQSPTINLFIEDENFVKLVENLPHYMSQPAQPYLERYVDPVKPAIAYPKIKVDDIEICCMHFKDCREAVEAWERRRKRVNLNNVFVIACSWNLHGNPEWIQRVCAVRYPKVIFSTIDLHRSDCVYLSPHVFHLDERGVARPDLTSSIPHTLRPYYEKLFDFVGWLNQRA